MNIPKIMPVIRLGFLFFLTCSTRAWADGSLRPEAVAGSSVLSGILVPAAGFTIFVIGFILAWNSRLRSRVRLTTNESEERSRRLAESEARTRAVLASMTSLVLVANARGRVLHVVRTNYEFKKYGPEEMEGKHFSEIVPEDDVPAVRKALRQVVRSGGSASCEFRMNLDMRRWFSMSVTPLGDTRILAVIRDITDIRRSEQKYRELVQLANCIILRLDTEGRVVFFNEYAERFFGYSQDEIIGRSILGTIVPECDSEGNDLTCMVSDVVADPGRHPHRENENQRKDGVRVWVDWSNRPIFEDGVFVGVLSIGNDVTQRKLAQREMTNREHYFRSLIEHTSDLITVIDETGAVFFEAPAVRACLGFDPDRVVGSSIYEHVHEDDQAMVHGVLRRLLDDYSGSQLFEFRRRGADGGHRHLEAVATNLLHDPVVGGIVVNSRDVTERKAFEDELRQHIFYDSLTGLPNRVLFLEHLKQAMEKVRRRGEYSFAVLFLNLDRFKLVNDGLGHSTGDELLKEVSERLKECMRKVDTVARIGGDEFILLLDEIDDDRIPIRAAERVQEALSASMLIRGVEVSTSASIGIVFSNSDYEDPEQIVRDADAAMHRAKIKGTGCSRVFHSRMHRQALSLLKLEQDLRRAMEREEFEVHYQPIVRLDDGFVVGLEALVRWNHPEEGLILPGRFIPLAEETGLIVPLGEWVLRRACIEVGQFRHNGKASGPVLAVNLSARQFTHPDLAVKTRSILEETGFDPKRLKLEVTESMLMESPAEAAAVLDDLRRTGLSLAIDDFGTGYSSLGTLHRYPFDTLKIDRSFVSQLTECNGTDTKKIIQTIMGLASGLGMKAIAEGIETEVQRRLLAELGCELGQGFHFARPMSARAVAGILDEQAGSPARTEALVVGE